MNNSMNHAASFSNTYSTSTKKVVCVGKICLDILTYVDRYPTEDSDSRCDSQVWAVGGNAANTSTVLTQLSESPPTLLGVLARDHSLQFMTQEFQSVGLSHKQIIIRDRCRNPISVAFISNKNGSRTIVHAANDLKELTVDEFKAFFQKKGNEITNYGWIHLEGRNAVETRKMMDYLVQERKRRVIPLKISVELEKVKPELLTLIPGADVIFVSKDFAAAQGYKDMQSCVRGIADFEGVGATTMVICAWGDKGAAGLSLTNPKLVHSCPPYPPKTIVDTLGAGDAFNAGCIHALNRSKPLDKALEFGCTLAGVKIGVRGMKDLALHMVNSKKFKWSANVMLSTL